MNLALDSRLFGPRFESSLLPGENKPLEMSVLKRVKELLAEADARAAARHITLVDCTVNTRHYTTIGAVLRLFITVFF